MDRAFLEFNQEQMHTRTHKKKRIGSTKARLHFISSMKNMDIT